ncbi:MULTISPECIES: FliM/FliN family flagellar motor switch protein [Novosphingobium]|uniref:Flagellar motor switch protein FliN n=1 Tax=Novosphingobium panipatense TaxID=428991 RepID=A0ABY1QP02_9SPHN|nr:MULTISPECIES: FliM/FliN family flagellar motor switch protein [Novosphingobium]SMP76248.1 flagellar motor switch protein FliN/FliY [Novosphingobium panipatense]
MSVLEGIPIDLSIVLGSTRIPIRQVLKMSRGAMIPLDCGQDDPTRLYVNDRLVAEGRILVNGESMSLEITRVMEREG